MKRLKNTLLLSAVIMFASGVQGCIGVQTASAQQEDGWVNLIQGEDLSENWVQRGGDALYRVEDGQIIGTTVPDTPNSFLCTKMEYSDFILELEVLVHPEMNSGIQIRSHSRAEYQNGRVHGYQVEIDPSDRAWSGGIYDEARRGWLFNLENRPEAQQAFKNGEWNTYRIVARGDTLETWVNGVPVATLADSMDPSGLIALQVHSTNESEPMEIRWRNIRVRLLE
jgi:hypothetical protein